MMTRTKPHPVIETANGSKIDLGTLSGNAYLSAIMRYAPTERIRLPIVAAENCDHTYTVCPTAKCLNSWSLDYQFFMQRTGGGRKIAEQFHLDDTAQVGLMLPDARHPHPRHDPFDSQYDIGVYSETLTQVRSLRDAEPT